MTVRNHHGRYLSGALHLSACASVFIAPYAFSQVGPGSAAGAGEELADIIVTATRREERLRDVPIADTAVSAKKLEEQQIADVTTLANIVPNMQAKPSLNPLQITLAIRGVTQLIASPAVDPPIGTYVDGVYNVLNAGSNIAMIDMERVEVLKGPQGTLFGRNTIGGAISITTMKPQDSFGGYVQQDAGNYGAYTTTAVLNLPISPGLLDTRLVFQHTQHEGYGRDLATGQPDNTLNQNYFRGSVKYTPSDKWDVLLSGFYIHAQGFAPATKLGYFASPFNASFPLAAGNTSGDKLSNYVNAGGFQDTYSSPDSTFKLDQYGVTNVITGHLNDAVTVKSISSYSSTDYQQVSDLDGTPYLFLNLIAFPVAAEQFSEELQAYGDALDDRLKWISGAYFFTVTGSQISNNATLFNLSPPAARTYNTNGPYVSNQSYSAFTQLTYELMPKLRLTAGVRYVVDDRKVTYLDHREVPGPDPRAFVSCDLANAASPVTAALGTSPGDCSFKSSVQYGYLPWTVGLDFKPNDATLLYAKVSKGYRSGAYPGNGPTATPPSATITAAQALTNNAAALALFGPVPPESLLSPEIGAKLDFLDGKLKVNAAGYFSRYDNIQLTVNVIPCPTCSTVAVLENSGNADMWGGELEVSALLGKLELDGAIGYTDPKYLSGSASFGQPVINVSKTNESLTASYPSETSAGLLTLTGTYAYRSGATFYTVTSGLPAAANAAVTQKGFGLLSARAAFTLANLPITLAIYGENLTNEKYKDSASDFPAPLSYAVYWPGPPLTFGGSIKYSF
jgi:iron complex outermembrane receptor protein